MTDAYTHLPYRPCAGIMLKNPQGLIFVGQRLDGSGVSSEAWQMPQGGVDDGEDPETAALRELGEETGLAPNHVDIITRSAGEHLYDLPPDLLGRIWKGQYRGQRQIWFLMNFLGRDEDVNIATAHQEFRDWRWAHVDELVDLIVPFKRELYSNVLKEFAPHL
ncbi:MAG: RNA pyrophosphohydrolase [Sphingomonadaceae bacterium]|nr:RNA pyrophosphohydrolase [Sphingomonadaceae bacterium]